MRKTRSGIFTKNASSLIAIESLIVIVIIFLDTFLVSKLLELTPGNYNNIAIFNIIYYLMIGLSIFLVPFLFKWVNKKAFIFLGSIVLAGLFAFVYLLGDNIVNYIILLGVLSGLGTGLFYSVFNNLVSEVVSSKVMTLYSSVKNIVIFIVKTIFPLTLGMVIDLGSFTVLSLIIVVISSGIIVITCFISNKKNKNESYNPLKFLKKIHKNDEYKPLKTLYLSQFFRGFCFDIIATCFVIMITHEIGQGESVNFKLGIIQTVFSVIQILSMFLFMKFYKKEKSGFFVFLPLTLILISLIPYFIMPSLTTAIVGFGTYTCLRIFITSITDIREKGVVRLLSLHKHIKESGGIISLIYAVSRIGSYSLLFLGAVVQGRILIFIVLGIAMFFFIVYAITLFVLEKQLIVQDINWKKTHPEIAVEEISQIQLPKIVEELPEVIEDKILKNIN